MQNKPRFSIGENAITFITKNDYGTIQRIIIGAVIINEDGIFYEEKGEVLSRRYSENDVFTKHEAKIKIQEFLDAK